MCFYVFWFIKKEFGTVCLKKKKKEMTLLLFIIHSVVVGNCVILVSGGSGADPEFTGHEVGIDPG